MRLKPLVTFVFGTRPEGIKIAPVILAFRESNELDIRIVLTGQHKEMISQVLDLFGIEEDENFNLMQSRQTLTHITSETLKGLQEDFNKFKPNLVIVQGDTTTAFAASLAAFYERIPVGHIEAGLRTGNFFDPFPEEVNRRLISQITSLHFAPTSSSVEHLQRSSVSGDIYLTGNTIVDALRLISENNLNQLYINGLDWHTQKVLLTTVHRRENWGEKIYSIANGLLRILDENKDTSIILPLHKNDLVRKPLQDILGKNERAFLIEPLDYQSFVSAMKHSYLVLTDSGGLQEEAPSFGKPVLVLRETTERPEAVIAGTAKLVGTKSDVIFNEVNFLLSDEQAYKAMSIKENPFGDGFASGKILEKCMKFLNL